MHLRSALFCASLVIIIPVLNTTSSALAQESSPIKQCGDSDVVMLKQVEESIKQERGGSQRNYKVESRLKDILQCYPGSALRPRVEEKLFDVQESLATEWLMIAVYYMNRYEKELSLSGEGKKGGLEGAKAWLQSIRSKFTRFSRMDKVVFLLWKIGVLEGDHNEAAAYFIELVNEYPDSQYVRRAFVGLQ